MEPTIQSENTQPRQSGMVHFILSRSYTIFLFSVVLGLILDIIMPFRLFGGTIYQYIGLAMIVLGSLLIYWAQSTSSKTKKEMESQGPRNFSGGPYRFSRNPTHIGLFIMTLGLGLVLNSLFSLALTILTFVFTKAIYIKKEEELLTEKYGQEYLDYKKKVGKWI